MAIGAIQTLLAANPDVRNQRALILAAESELLALPDNQKLSVEDLTTHTFAPGIYTREMRIPAGKMAAGKIHRFGHISIMSAGELLVFTEDGVVHLLAPATIVSKPGTKRVVFALQDTVWTTVHPNPDNETDVATLEARYIAPSYDDVPVLAQNAPTIEGSGAP